MPLARLVCVLAVLLCACDPSPAEFDRTDAPPRDVLDDTGDDDDDELPWDPSPPEAIEGTRIVGQVSCGWLTGPQDVSWERLGESWLEESTEGGSTTVRPELMPCFGAPANPAYDHRLSWYDDGTMFFQAGGLDHDLWPIGPEMTWLGEVVPTGGPSPECLDALEAVGMELPVIMQLEIVAIEVAT
jgi:hypothetical protein